MSLASYLKDKFTTASGDWDWAKILGAGAAGYGIYKALDNTDNLEGLKNFLGINEANEIPVGYTGGIPRYEYYRQQVPMYGSTDVAAYDPTRRPGSAGRRYFTQVQTVDQAPVGADVAAVQAYKDRVAAAQAATEAEKWRLATENLGNLARQSRPVYGQTNEQIQQQLAGLGGDKDDPNTQMAMLNYANRSGVGLGQLAEATGEPYGVAQQRMKGLSGLATPRAANAQAYNPQSIQNTLNQLIAGSQQAPIGMMEGGLASLDGMGQGYYLGGATNGMADKIPATIDGTQPAALSDGEFVIPADVVSAVGGGNSNAGAKQFYNMMDRVRQQAYGRKDQINPVNPNKVLPA
jgi:hypothetical protein